MENIEVKDLKLWDFFYNTNGHKSFIYRVTHEKLYVMNLNGSFYTVNIENNYKKYKKCEELFVHAFLQTMKAKLRPSIPTEKSKLEIVDKVISVYSIAREYQTCVGISEVIAKGLDPHTWMASTLFNICPTQVTPKQRQQAEAYNFRDLYGKQTSIMSYTLPVGLDKTTPLHKALNFNRNNNRKKLLLCGRK